METAQSGVSVQDALFNTAAADSENFAVLFRKIRKMYPAEVTLACLSYLAHKGLDGAGHKMALWLAAETKYLKVLFDTSALPLEIVTKASTAMIKADAQFLAKFLKEAETLSITPHVVRALRIAPITDNGALLLWVKKLSQHNDDRIRSRAVKLLCEIRPNKAQIERQMLDENARVRANAIEVLWHSKTVEARELFKAALADTNHRVVGNALIGLHLQGAPEALSKMAELCESQQVAVRRAMAWCLGFLQDERGIPLLQTLSKDPAPVVRNRALRSLLALQPQETAAA
jgi:HEAT repeat protein